VVHGASDAVSVMVSKTSLAEKKRGGVCSKKKNKKEFRKGKSWKQKGVSTSEPQAEAFDRAQRGASRETNGPRRGEGIRREKKKNKN